jgi:tetratricopeptide (TPR) repeat protein
MILASLLILVQCFKSNTILAQVEMPAPSPKQTIEQQFGMGSIKIVYSRPSARDRKVFGDLVPYGKIWRTGANEATLISFSEPVEIDGKKVDSGTYALYTILYEDVWEVILNKGISNWGTENYLESEDVFRSKIEPVKNKTKVETFTILLTNLKKENCQLQLLWDKKILNIPIAVDIKEKLRAQINAAMLVRDRPYWQAAQFYYEYDRNLPKALENIDKAIESNQQAYWMYLYKANIQKDMSNNAGALKSSITSLQLAKDAKNDDYVRMNQHFQNELKRTQ